MIAVAFALWLLATLDTALAGFRAAAGRSLLIDKRSYYVRAMARGSLLGQIPVAVAGGAVLARWVSSWAREAALAEFHSVGAWLLALYLPYAGLVALGFAVRAVPSTDVRSIASVALFGPLTLLRPIVVIAGGAAAMRAVETLQARVIVALIVAMMLSFGPLLERSIRQT